MIRTRRGIAKTTVVGVVVVAILVVVGISLAVLSPGPTKSASTTGSSASTTAPSSATSAQSTASSVSTSASAFTSSSSGFRTTLSCPTSTTTTESLAQTFDLAPLFGNFSAMSAYVYELRGQNSAAVDSNYSVIQSTGTAFKVSVTSNATGASTLTTAWVLRNGTVASASQAGYNFTGTQAEQLLLQSMNPLLLEVSQSTLTPNPSEVGATLTNQGTITIGPTKVSVSNYASNELPVTLTQCTTIQTVTKFVFQTGAAQGATFPLLTVFDVDAYQMVNGQQYPIEVVFMVTSVTAG